MSDPLIAHRSGLRMPEEAQMYRSILVPLDGSRLAEWALPAAINIARRQAARLELVTIDRVRPTVSGIDGLTFSDGDEAWSSAAEDEALTYLTELARRIQALHPVQVKSTVRAGLESAPDQLVAYAHDADIDLIVMATHGYGLFKRFWLGSVADAVARHSRIATLLVRPQPDAAADLTGQIRFRNVLLPLDGSETAETIIDHALEVGGHDAEYTLFQALPLMPVFTSEYVAVAATVDAQMLRARQNAAEAMLETLAERIRLRDRRFQVHTATATEASSAGAILDYAERNHNDLIALTTHGLGGAVRMMLGSVADKVTRGAEVPVLLYRPAEEA
jgi:nucleotide-binding universal stress UspA family protein